MKGQIYKTRPTKGHNLIPIFVFDLSESSYAAITYQISQSYPIEVIRMKYIDAEGDDADFDNQQEYQYIANEMKKDPNKPVVFYLVNPPVDKKPETSSKMILKFSLNQKQQKFQISLLDCSQKQLVLKKFRKFLAQCFGRKIFELEYLDDQESEIFFEIDSTVGGSTKMRSDGWPQFLEDLKKMLEAGQVKEMDVKIAPITPEFDKKGQKKIILWVTEKRQKQITFRKDTTFEQLCTVVFENFGKKYIKVFLDIQNDVNCEAFDQNKFKVLLENAYNGTVMFIEDYYPEHMVDVILKFGKKERVCCLDLSQSESLEQFQQTHIFKHIEKDSLLKLQYEEDSYRTDIINEQSWSIFKQQLQDKSCNNVIFVCQHKGSSSKRSDNSSKKSSQIYSNPRGQQQKIEEDPKELEQPVKQETYLDKFSRKLDENHKKFVEEIKDQGLKLQKKVQSSSKPAEQNSKKYGNYYCPDCCKNTLDSFLYRYCESCCQYHKIQSISDQPIQKQKKEEGNTAVELMKLGKNIMNLIKQQ